jgi:methionine aminopeptidase
MYDSQKLILAIKECDQTTINIMEADVAAQEIGKDIRAHQNLGMRLELEYSAQKTEYDPVSLCSANGLKKIDQQFSHIEV